MYIHMKKGVQLDTLTETESNQRLFEKPLSLILECE